MQKTVYIALLRGINVGGQRVKMDHLRELFTQLDFSNVRSYIQTGNVFFETTEEDVRGIQERIEDHLKTSLGYAVAVCLRTATQLQKVIDLLKDHIGDLFIGGWYSKIKHWLDQVPRNIFRKEKQILVYLALSNIMLGDRREGKEILDALDMSDNRVDDLLSYMIYCGAIYLLHFNHQIPQMLALANKIVGKYPPGMESWNAGVEMILAKGETVMGNIAASNQRLNGIIAFALKEDLPLLNLTAAVQLAINYIHQGDLAYAKMTCKKYIRRSDWHSFPLVGLFYAVLGDIQREHGQLEESRVNIQTAREYIHLVGGIGALGWIELTYFRIQFALGNLVQCEDILENLDTQLHSADAPPWLLDGLYAAKIKLWNVLGKKKRIQNFVAEKHTFFSGNINFSNFQSHLEYIHYLIISPDEDQAVDFVTNKRMYLEKAVALASESRWIDLLIRCQIERAILESSEGNFEQAYAALEHAIKLGSRGGYQRVFIENWDHLKGLIRRENLTISRLGYLEKIIAIAKEDGRALGLSQTLLTKPLTKREIEVLKRLDSVFSIPEIAESLGVAPSTVRSHVKHIFSKLSVHNRMEAVHAAKELNIL